MGVVGLSFDDAFGWVQGGGGGKKFLVTAYTVIFASNPREGGGGGYEKIFLTHISKISKKCGCF